MTTHERVLIVRITSILCCLTCGAPSSFGQASLSNVSLVTPESQYYCGTSLEDGSRGLYTSPPAGYTPSKLRVAKRLILNQVGYLDRQRRRLANIKAAFRTNTGTSRAVSDYRRVVASLQKKGTEGLSAELPKGKQDRIVLLRNAIGLVRTKIANRNRELRGVRECVAGKVLSTVTFLSGGALVEKDGTDTLFGIAIEAPASDADGSYTNRWYCVKQPYSESAAPRLLSANPCAFGQLNIENCERLASEGTIAYIEPFARFTSEPPRLAISQFLFGVTNTLRDRPVVARVRGKTGLPEDESTMWDYCS